MHKNRNSSNEKGKKINLFITAVPLTNHWVAVFTRNHPEYTIIQLVEMRFFNLYPSTAEGFKGNLTDITENILLLFSLTNSSTKGHNVDSLYS